MSIWNPSQNLHLNPSQIDVLSLYSICVWSEVGSVTNSRQILLGDLRRIRPQTLRRILSFILWRILPWNLWRMRSHISHKKPFEIECGHTNKHCKWLFRLKCYPRRRPQIWVQSEAALDTKFCFTWKLIHCLWIKVSKKLIERIDLRPKPPSFRHKMLPPESSCFVTVSWCMVHGNGTAATKMLKRLGFRTPTTFRV